MFWRKSQSPGTVDCSCNDPCACECPEVDVSCSGTTIWASMCGHPGFTVDGVISTNYYRALSAGGFWRIERYNSINSCVFENIEGLRSVTHIQFTGTSIYPCGGSPSGITEIVTEETWSGGEMTDSETTINTVIFPGTEGTKLSETTSHRLIERDCNFSTDVSYTDRTITLSNPDTEEDAIARGTPEPTSQRDSIWQIRTSGRNFQYRGVSYTLILSGVRPNRDYLVTPSIRRREAFMPGGGAIPWEPAVVTPEIINFTDSDPRWDAETKTYTLDPVPLPLVRGWQYEITGAEIEII